MHTYSFPDAKNIVVCGDIHGHFNEVIFKMCVQFQMTDTLLIIAGDCGFGFEKLDTMISSSIATLHDYVRLTTGWLWFVAIMMTLHISMRKG